MNKERRNGKRLPNEKSKRKVPPRLQRPTEIDQPSKDETTDEQENPSKRKSTDKQKNTSLSMRFQEEKSMQEVHSLSLPVIASSSIKMAQNDLIPYAGIGNLSLNDGKKSSNISFLQEDSLAMQTSVEGIANSRSEVDSRITVGGTAAPTHAYSTVDMLPEFQPGKPWKGFQQPNAEEDPYVTPGSIARNPFSLNIITLGSLIESTPSPSTNTTAHINTTIRTTSHMKNKVNTDTQKSLLHTVSVFAPGSIANSSPLENRFVPSGMANTPPPGNTFSLGGITTSPFGNAFAPGGMATSPILGNTFPTGSMTSPPLGHTFPPSSMTSPPLGNTFAAGVMVTSPPFQNTFVPGVMAPSPPPLRNVFAPGGMATSPPLGNTFSPGSMTSPPLGNPLVSGGMVTSPTLGHIFAPGGMATSPSLRSPFVPGNMAISPSSANTFAQCGAMYSPLSVNTYIPPYEVSETINTTPVHSPVSMHHVTRYNSVPLHFNRFPSNAISPGGIGWPAIIPNVFHPTIMPNIAVPFQPHVPNDIRPVLAPPPRNGFNAIRNPTGVFNANSYAPGFGAAVAGNNVVRIEASAKNNMARGATGFGNNAARDVGSGYNNSRDAAHELSSIGYNITDESYEAVGAAAAGLEYNLWVAPIFHQLEPERSLDEDENMET